MKTTNDKEGLLVELPGRSFRVLVDEEILQSQKMSFGISVVPKESELPWHKHEGSEEIIYVMEGSGKAESRTDSCEIGPGTVLCVELSSEHRIINTGSGQLRLLCSYSPPVKIRPPK